MNSPIQYWPSDYKKCSAARKTRASRKERFPSCSTCYRRPNGRCRSPEILRASGPERIRTFAKNCAAATPDITGQRIHSLPCRQQRQKSEQVDGLKDVFPFLCRVDLVPLFFVSLPSCSAFLSSFSHA